MQAKRSAPKAAPKRAPKKASATLVDYDALDAARLRTDPYPYVIANDIIAADRAADVEADFPEMDKAGSIPVAKLDYGPAFAAFVEELKSDRFRTAIGKKFGVDLKDKEILVTARGQMRITDGNIHTDTPEKLITILIYFNRDWPDRTSALRILRGGEDLEDYVEEAPPALGTMVAFKVTDNCWHGHTEMQGPRKSIQMNYLSGVKLRGKHQPLHRLRGQLKRAWKRWKAR
jgi:hypothetical protein